MAKQSLMEKMMSAGYVKAEILEDSDYFRVKDAVTTDLPILNVAFSGDLDGGLVPGLTIYAGPSKSFKTLLGLLCMRAYMDKYPEAIVLFYDSEFGVTPEYLEANGIDGKRVLHVPVKHVEELKFDMLGRLEQIEKGDRVFILIDSIGNLASKKEVEDAINEKSVADMSRAKAIKSLWRIVTPHLTMKDIPCVAINHIYMCLDGDTGVQTLDGIRPIREIDVGDLVFTDKGLKPVTRKFDPAELDGSDKEFLELEFDDGSIVRCTHDHRFMMPDGSWVEARDLVTGAELATVA